MSTWIVAALYKFAPLPRYRDLREPIALRCEELGVKGTLLLAEEGINGTVSGSRAAIDGLLATLRAVPGLEELEHKESLSEDCPFYRMKVRLKREIVTMGVPGVDPSKKVGTYVEPEDWNALVDDPEVVLVDTRNDYEVRVGTFDGAVDPKIESFREFPDWVATHLDPKRHKKVAMFCTGGIRCEKATSHLLELGFDGVYHLKGGILKYLERVAEPESKWEGECFVFDGRVAVGHGLELGEHRLCFGCQQPLSPAELQDPAYEEGVACPYCVDEVDDATRQRRRQRMRQLRLADSRGHAHLGQSESEASTRRAEKLAHKDAQRRS